MGDGRGQRVLQTLPEWHLHARVRLGGDAGGAQVKEEREESEGEEGRRSPVAAVGVATAAGVHSRVAVGMGVATSVATNPTS